MRVCLLDLGETRLWDGDWVRIGRFELLFRQVRLSGWLGQLERLSERYGGVVHDFVGDGCYCWWPDTPGVEGCVSAAKSL